jgi:hypothetical protein
MTDEQRGTGFWAAVVAVCILATPVVYLLALGPLYFCVANGTLSLETWMTLIYPIQLWSKVVDNKPEWFWSAYESDYLMWFGALAGG